MFPQITNNKKNKKIGTPQMIKQCQQILKQIQFKSKKAIKSIPNELVADFNKVCKLKDINSFYSHYFFYFIQKQQKTQMENIFLQQIQNIMLGKSFYQKIHELIKQRSNLIYQAKEQMNLVQGFSIMNSGKNVPHTLKSLINNLIKDCNSLQAVKKIQIAQVQKFTDYIKRLRKNLKEIVQMFISWQFYLKSFKSIAQISSFKKMRVIFPQNQISCIFIGLYDTQFLRTSFLTTQIKFLNVDYDPFFLYLQPMKKTNKTLQDYFLNKLKEQNQNYKRSHDYIFTLDPKNAKQIQSQKQIQIKRNSKSSNKLLRSKSKQRKISEKKVKQNYLNTKLLNQTGDFKRKHQSLKKLINVDQIQNAYKSRKLKKSVSKQLQKSKSKSIQKSDVSLLKSSDKAHSVVFVEQRQVTVSISNKSINSKSNAIQKIDRPKSMAHLQINTKLQKQYNIYKEHDKLKNNNNNKNINKVQQIDKKSLIDLSKSQIKIKDQSYKQILIQKQILIRELNHAKKQKLKYQKLLNKIQNKNSNQNKIYQNKMKKYQNQMDQLKQKIQNIKYNKYNNNNNNNNQKERPKSIINNLLLSKVYSKKKNAIDNNNNNDNIYKIDNQSPTNLSPNKLSLSRLPQQNILLNRLTQSINQNKALQNKIKQLTKQKLKMQKVLQKQGHKSNKQKQIYQRKLQKYQQVINKFKNKSNDQKNNILLFKKNAYLNNKIKNIEQYQKLEQKQIMKQVQQLNNQQKLKKSELKIINDKKTIQIVYNKKKSLSKKQLQDKNIMNNNNSTLMNKSLYKQRDIQQHMLKLAKQKNILQRKLDLKQNNQSIHQSILLKKLQQKQTQLQKYRQRIQRQKQSQIKYQQKIKQLRKKINQQYQKKLLKQKQKFIQQKQHLYYKIKQQKEDKLEKQKYLSKQMIYLKEMQLRENQLKNLLENQRKQREIKQRELEEEIIKKKILLEQYEIQEIKRTIQKELRQQMNFLNSEQGYNDQNNQYLLTQSKIDPYQNIQQKKRNIQKQIKQMLEQNDYELKQLDQQNQKLKSLIQKIKQQEEKVILQLQSNIQIQNYQDKQDEQKRQYQSQREELNQIQDNKKSNNLYLTNEEIQQSRMIIDELQRQKQITNNYSINSITHNQNNQKLKNNQSSILLQQLNYKSQFQLSRQKLINSRYKQIQQSPVYRQRQKIQNIIELYLKNPHNYNSNNNNDRNLIMKNKQKNQIIQQVVNKNKKVKEFQQQLMDLKNVQNFIPAERDDPITKHMLNLRQAYENQEAESLRRVLFPALNENQKYLRQNQHQLSFQSQQSPPITLGDHIKLHQQNYLSYKQESNIKNKKNSKNFMSINKMKLLQIEQEKRQKQRKLIQDQAKKKVKKIRYKEKKKQQKEQKQFQIVKIQLQQKQKKRQEQLEKAKKGQNKQLNKVNDKEIKQRNNQLIKRENQNKNKKSVQQIIQKKQLQKQNEQYDEQFEDQNQNQFLDINDINDIKNDKQIKDKQKKQQDKQQNLQQEQNNQFLNLKQPSLQSDPLSNIPSENIALFKLQKSKQQLKNDILSYQQQIRSYISASFDYQIYQHYVIEKQLQTYIKQLLELSSQENVKLNNNKTLFNDIKQVQCLVILIAKDQHTNLQIGIGIFHKQYQQQQYICDYLLSHNIKNLLNLSFNFSNFLYKNDQYTNSIQFIFSFAQLTDPLNKLHFIEYQQKCKRLGQVYFKVNQNQTRKYILKRNLFENVTNNMIMKQGKGILFTNKIQVHQNYMKQKKQGFVNKFNHNYTSQNILLSLYLKDNPSLLQKFKKQFQNDLNNRQTLLTALVFQKKQFTLKNIKKKYYDTVQKIQLYKNNLLDIFNVQDIQQNIQQMEFQLQQALPKSFKRCILQINQQSLNYCLLEYKQPLNIVQASNSCQLGVFLPLIAKYKVLILPANQFLTACQTNIDMNIFFYIKHYIKNISDAKKQTFSRIYLPQTNLSHWTFYQNISKKLNQTFFGKEEIQIGFKSKINNSLIYTPHHTDLVLERPFIISVLSANVEKTVEGSPIFCKLIM